MAPQTLSKPKVVPSVEKTVQQLRDLCADAPQMAKTGLENALPTLLELAADASRTALRNELVIPRDDYLCLVRAQQPTPKYAQRAPATATMPANYNRPLSPMRPKDRQHLWRIDSNSE